MRHRPLVDSANLAALVPGMVAALQRGGTAELASLADVGITVAGKTGTVQNDEGDDHANFAGFAPATKPRIVVAVYIENAGFGGLSAAPLAALIMEKYLKGHIAPQRKKMGEVAAVRRFGRTRALTRAASRSVYNLAGAGCRLFAGCPLAVSTTGADDERTAGNPP